MTIYYTETETFSQVPSIPRTGLPVNAADMRSTIQALVNRDASTIAIVGTGLSQGTHGDLINTLMKYDPHFQKTTGLDSDVTISLPLTSMVWQSVDTVWRPTINTSTALTYVNMYANTDTTDSHRFIIDIPTQNFYDTYITNVTAYVSNVSNSTFLPKLYVVGQPMYFSTPDISQQAYLSDLSSDLTSLHQISLDCNIPVQTINRYVVMFSPGYGTGHVAGLNLYGITVTFSNSNS